MLLSLEPKKPSLGLGTLSALITKPELTLFVIRNECSATYNAQDLALPVEFYPLETIIYLTYTLFMLGTGP
jgi:hypothetical protein